jgi:NADH-quinone oxidoreductase subunit L
LVTTLLMPLMILLVAHGVLQIQIRDSQGAVIFLFFIWVTSSQAILTLTRLRAVASWKVSAAMLIALLVIVFTYLFAAERFTAFLYPDRDVVDSYYRAAALPGFLFDGLVVMTTLLIFLGWVFLSAQTTGHRLRTPPWMERARIHLYVFFMNRLYLDAAYTKVGQVVMRIATRLDKGLFERAR